jgi:segregation and condensation protein B
MQNELNLNPTTDAVVTESNEANTYLQSVVESLLLASDEPLSIETLCQTLQHGGLPITKNELRPILATIGADYSKRPLELKEVASGFRLQLRSDFSPWLARLLAQKPPRYSRALLETLAIIAYKQPITRGEIEDIRGVSVGSNIIKTLLDYEWIKIVGYKEVPGRPAFLATTAKFLDYFNMTTLEELPQLPDINFLEIEAQEIAAKLGDVMQLKLPEEHFAAQESQAESLN